jgi:hypothetical protein
MEVGPQAVDYFEIIFYDEPNEETNQVLFTDKNNLHEFFSDVLAQQTLVKKREMNSHRSYMIQPLGKIRGYYDEDKSICTDFSIRSFENIDFFLGYIEGYVEESYTPIDETRLIPEKWVEFFELREHNIVTD